MLPQQYCLRWKYHHSNLQTMFSQLLDRGCFCDVTLACEGQTLKAHRVVLCACSTYFDTILTNCCAEKDPIIIMKDAKFDDIKCLIQFMYKGEINVEHGNLASLLRTAEELRIKGLAEVSWRDENNDSASLTNTKFETNTNTTKYNTNRSLSGTTTPSAEASAATTTSPQALLTLKRETTANTQTISTFAESTTPNITEAQHSQESSPPATADTAGGDASLPIPMLAPIHSQKLEHSHYISSKKKRGRPPLDGEFDTYSSPKLAQIDNGSLYPDSSHLVSVMMDENSKELLETHREDISSFSEHNIDMEHDENENIARHIFVPKAERPDTPNDYIMQDGDESAPPSPSEPGGSGLVLLTPQEQEEWKDVVKMNDYLTKGRRPQFWEEPFTKRIMDAIKNKDLEMKKAAQLLGVSYGTLYGRYRETYGCLKHPYRGPFLVSRLREMWTDQGPSEIIGMLQRGVISLSSAAELMNTSPAIISGYLDQLQEWSLLNDQDPLESDDKDKDKGKENGLSNTNYSEMNLINLKKTKV